ncbi:MAG: YitT family protein, partial [Clostridia bacterium]|nr:YitT family protein [Clostridia bacterium]
EQNLFYTDQNAAAKPSKNKISPYVFIRYLIITLGCLLYATGISLFVEAADLSSGGMTGISLIINSVTGFPTGYLYIILNVPMFILGLIFFGWKFLLSTSYATVVSGLLMRFGKFALHNWIKQPFTQNVLINAVVGGVLFGVGMGLIFRMGASTAGTDVIVKILRKRFRHMKTGMISLITDMIIVGCSLFIPSEGNKFDRLFYTALHVVVFTLVFDWVLYGGNSAKTVFIITVKDKYQQIVDRILKEVDTGATVLDAKGAYTNEDKVMLMCVVKPFLYPRLRDVVREEDKKAFMIVSSAKEIYGEGYQNPDAEEL